MYDPVAQMIRKAKGSQILPSLDLVRPTDPAVAGLFRPTDPAVAGLVRLAGGNAARVWA
jgi:hypothetical protein